MHKYSLYRLSFPCLTHTIKTGYTEEINMIESKLDTQDMEVVRQLALAHYKAGLLCQAQEDVNESIEHLEKGLNSIKLTGDDNQDTEAMIADTLGVLYASKDDYSKAKQYFSDSYSLYERTLGREHMTTSECAFRLGKMISSPVIRSRSS